MKYKEDLKIVNAFHRSTRERNFEEVGLSLITKENRIRSEMRNLFNPEKHYIVDDKLILEMEALLKVNAYQMVLPINKVSELSEEDNDVIMITTHRKEFEVC